MAQVPKFPSNLFFYCDIEPNERGETPICFSNAVYERINQEMPHFVKNLLDKQVRYTRILPEDDDPSSIIGRSWKSAYLTQDKQEAERKCREQGSQFEWLPDGSLKTTSKTFPAIKQDPRTGKLFFFNLFDLIWYSVHSWKIQE